jgi:methylmalonyl-CoA mutase cobalamin-binding subunit
MYLLSQQVVEDYRPLFKTDELKGKVKGKRFLLASTDVHEHAIGALAQLLSEAGAEVINLGAEQAPEQVINRLQNDSVDAVLLSTHNGMALDYARMLQSRLQENNFELPILMGGVLNQKMDGEVLPVPVINELKAMGFHPAIGLPNLTKLLT